MKKKISFQKRKVYFLFIYSLKSPGPLLGWAARRTTISLQVPRRAIFTFFFCVCFPQSICLVLLGSWIDRNPLLFSCSATHNRERETIVPSVEKRAPMFFFFLGWWLRAPGATASLPSVGSRSSSFPLLCGLSSFNKATSSDQSLPERIVFFLCVFVIRS